MSRRPTRRRAMVFTAAMGAAALLSVGLQPTRHSASEHAGVTLDLLFPRTIGDWRIDQASAAFVRAPNESGKLYGVYDQMLERAYINSVGDRIMLSVAYGSEQSAALQLHRPEVCYGSDGFEVTKPLIAALDLQPGTLPVTRLYASMLGRSEPITYWTVLGDTVVADSGAFWRRRWASSLRGEVLDGMLVRVSSIDLDVESAYRLHANFVQQLSQSMASRWRGRVFGAALSATAAGA